MGDFLAHCIDTALWLNGSVSDVTAMTETFVKERKHQLTGKMEKVTIDDACSFLCHFKNGSLGWKSIHVTDGDHPCMGKWWVPGLAIGYEHSFVH